MIKEILTEDNKIYKCLAPTNLADAVDAPSVISVLNLWNVLEINKRIEKRYQL